MLKKLKLLIPLFFIFPYQAAFASTSSSSNSGNWLMDGLLSGIGNIITAIVEFITTTIASGFSMAIGGFLDIIYEFIFNKDQIVKTLFTFIEMPFFQIVTKYVTWLAIAIILLKLISDLILDYALAVGSETGQPLIPKVMKFFFALFLVIAAPEMLKIFTTFLLKVLTDIEAMTLTSVTTRTFEQVISTGGTDIIWVLILGFALLIFGLVFIITTMMRGMKMVVGLWMLILFSVDILKGDTRAYTNKIKEFAKILTTVAVQLIFIKLIMGVLFDLNSSGVYIVSILKTVTMIIATLQIPNWIDSAFEGTGGGKAAIKTGYNVMAKAATGYFKKG